MKLAISAALLMLAVGSPVYAVQEPDKDKEKPPKQEEPRKQEPARQQEPPKEKEKQPQDRPQEKQPPRDTKQDREQTDRSRPPEKQQQQHSENDRAKQDRAAQDRAQQQQRDARTRDEHNNVQQAQRDGGNHNGRRIREEDFRAHFGREHSFRVPRRDDRRFNYGGYWFVYNDPWPAGWSYNDDVYVDEIDGEYYLIDPVHPGIRILLIVQD